jgi:hypothetical protein
METYRSTIDKESWLVLSTEDEFLRYLRSADGKATGGRLSPLRASLQRIPLRGPLRTAVLAPIRLRNEPRHRRLSRERLEAAAALERPRTAAGAARIAGVASSSGAVIRRTLPRP